jgi:hypothetical protein
MEWTWRIENGAHVLGLRPLPPGVDEMGFRGRLLAPVAEDSWLRRPHVRPHQAHGVRVERVAAPGALGECDAVRTTQAGLLLTVRTADCLPIVLTSPTEGLSLVHAGWRGLAAGVVEAALATFGDPSGVHAVIGPAIGVCCFEVGTEVASRFPERTRSGRGRGGRPHVDLPGEAADRLARAGVARGAIVAGAPCTRCHQHLLHSHRGSGGRPGRLVAFASRAPTPSHAE